MIPSFTRIVELAPDVVPVEPGAVFCARCLMLHGMNSRCHALCRHDCLVVLDASLMLFRRHGFALAYYPADVVPAAMASRWRIYLPGDDVHPSSA